VKPVNNERSVSLEERATGEERAKGRAAETSCDLGILFIHGIGEQREGETLLQFGEPIIQWIKRWIIGHGQGPDDGVWVRRSVLMPSRRIRRSPAHASIEIKFTPLLNENPRLQTWLFAETFWGEQVQAPKVLTLLGWLVSRGPWVFLLHLTQRARRFTRPIFRYIAWFLALATWILLTALLQLSLLFLSAVAIIPIPRIRRALSAFLLRTAGVLGDSYVLISQEAQRGAILTRFRESLEWLRRQGCKAVVVIAHSQGAAVAYDLLRTEPHSGPHLLITFGAGVVKLEQLRLVHHGNPWALQAAGWVVPLALAAVLTGLRIINDATLPHYAQLLPVMLGILAAGCVFYALRSVRATRVELQKNQRETASSERAIATRWIDLYATHDPVPQGGLDEGLGRPLIMSEEIVNERSYIGDHTGYLTNDVQFVSRLVSILDDVTQLLTLRSGDLADRLKEAENHHRRAVTLLALTRWVNIVALVFIAIWFCDELSRNGSQILSLLDKGPFSKVGTALHTAGDIVTWSTQLIINRAPTSSLGHGVLALSFAVLVTALWRRCFFPLWRWWDRALFIDVTRETDQMGRYGRWLVLPFVSVVGVLPGLLFFLYLYRELRSFELMLYIAPAIVVYGSTAISLIIVLATAGVGVVKEFPKYRSEARNWLKRSVSPDTGWSELITVVIMPAAAMLLAPVFVLAAIGGSQAVRESALSSFAVFGLMVLIGILLEARIGARMHAKGMSMRATAIIMIVSFAVACTAGIPMWRATPEDLGAPIALAAIIMLVTSRILAAVVLTLRARWARRP
jgi:hypothetical protein